MKSIRPMYVFTVLALLFCVTIWFMIREATGSDTMAVMTAAMGGILTLMGTVVNHEFRPKEPDRQPNRQTDKPAEPT